MKGLKLNVSWIQAADVQNSPVNYFLNSSYFIVNQATGAVFLITRLPVDNLNVANKIFITISAFSRLGSVTLTNQVNILNVNSRRPEFVNAQTIFEIQEV